MAITISFYAKVFRYNRQLLKLSQTQLGERLGLPQSTVQRIENGLRQPKPVLLEKLAKLRGLTIEQMVFQTFLS